MQEEQSQLQHFAVQSGKQRDKIVGVTCKNVDPDKGDNTTLTDGAQSIAPIEYKIPPQRMISGQWGNEYFQAIETENTKKVC